MNSYRQFYWFKIRLLPEDKKTDASSQFIPVISDIFCLAAIISGNILDFLERQKTGWDTGE